MIEQAIRFVTWGAWQIGAGNSIATGPVEFLAITIGVRAAQRLNPAGRNVDKCNGRHAHCGLFIHLPGEVVELLVADETATLTGTGITGITRAHLLHDALRTRMNGEVDIETGVHRVLLPDQPVGAVRNGDHFALAAPITLPAGFSLANVRWHFGHRLFYRGQLQRAFRIGAKEIFPGQADVVQIGQYHVQRFGWRVRAVALAFAASPLVNAAQILFIRAARAHRQARLAIGLAFVGDE